MGCHQRSNEEVLLSSASSVPASRMKRMVKIVVGLLGDTWFLSSESLVLSFFAFWFFLTLGIHFMIWPS